MLYSLDHWILFFTAALILDLSPGPDVFYILSNTVAHGRRVGIAAMAGVCSGAVFHVLAAAFGLSAILATSATAFAVVKWAGAAYLVYLGIQTLRKAGGSLNVPTDGAPKVSTLAVYRQGMLVDLLNPKPAVFFMAFLPQFVDPALGFVPGQLVLLGFLVIGVAIVVETAYVIAAARLTGTLRRHPAIGVWLDRVLGTVLIGLGVRLAFQQRP